MALCFPAAPEDVVPGKVPLKHLPIHILTQSGLMPDTKRSVLPQLHLLCLQLLLHPRNRDAHVPSNSRSLIRESYLEGDGIILIHQSQALRYNPDKTQEAVHDFCLFGICRQQSDVL